MATTTLALWNDRSDMTGVIIGGITVSWEKIDLATDRASAIDIGMTEDLCDAFESTYEGRVDYTRLAEWLEQTIINATVPLHTTEKRPDTPGRTSSQADPRP